MLYVIGNLGITAIVSGLALLIGRCCSSMIAMTALPTGYCICNTICNTSDVHHTVLTYYKFGLFLHFHWIGLEMKLYLYYKILILTIKFEIQSDKLKL